MAKKKTDIDWVKEHFGELINEGKKIQSCDASLECKVEEYEKTGYWPALKLMVLKYYIEPYLRILGKNEMKTAYIDLFAGPGLNLLGKYRTPVPGSPLISLWKDNPTYPFSLYVFCEINGGRANSLEKRSCSFPSCKDKIKIRIEDANKLIQNLPQILSENEIDHSLIFIDPEGCEFSWASLNKLVTDLDTNCDLIINFPSSGIPRLIPYPQKMTEFLGPGSERMPEKHKVHDWAIAIYRKNLESIGLNISTEIRISGTGAYHYHLIPAVRTTRGSSPWFQIFEGVKKRVESLDSPSLKILADFLEGRIKSIQDF